MLPPMCIALATRSGLPAWEVDDRHLHRALAAAGCAFEQPVWDDPAVDWQRYAAVLIRTTWDYQDKLAAFRQWARRVIPPNHDPMETDHVNRPYRPKYLG